MRALYYKDVAWVKAERCRRVGLTPALAEAVQLRITPGLANENTPVLELWPWTLVLQSRVWFDSTQNGASPASRQRHLWAWGSFRNADCGNALGLGGRDACECRLLTSPFLGNSKCACMGSGIFFAKQAFLAFARRATGSWLGPNEGGVGGFSSQPSVPGRQV